MVSFGPMQARWPGPSSGDQWRGKNDGFPPFRTLGPFSSRGGSGVRENLVFAWEQADKNAGRETMVVVAGSVPATYFENLEQQLIRSAGFLALHYSRARARGKRRPVLSTQRPRWRQAALTK